MGATESPLARSLEGFAGRKRLCIGYLERLLAAREAFERDFPGFGGGSLEPSALRSAIGRIGNARLRIFVAGQFKTGKSSLINAILGSPVLPADVLPCTAVITEIEYGERPAATIFFRPCGETYGLPDCLAPAVAAHISAHAPGQPPPLEIGISRGDELFDYLAIADPAGEQAAGANPSPICRCLLRWPLELLRSGVVLVDSPGLNEAAERERDSLAHACEADVVLHVLSAMQFMGRPDRDFISFVNGLGGMPMLFVVNRFDMVGGERQRARLREHALKNELLLRTAHGGSGIFFTSASHALAARESGDLAALGRSGLLELEDALASILDRDRARIKLGNLGAMLDGLRLFGAHGPGAALRRLGAERESLEAELAAGRRELAEFSRRRDRIRERLERGLALFCRDIRLRAGGFFDAFAGDPLHRAVYEAKMGPIRMLSRESDTRLAVRALCRAAARALDEAFQRWLTDEAAAAYAAHMEKMCADIRQEFDGLARDAPGLAHELDLGGLGSFGIEVGIGGFLDNVFDGAAVGAGLVFVASRFFPALLGPAGWALMLAGTAAGAFSAVMGSRGVDRAVRRNFLSGVRGEFPATAARNANLLTDALAQRMRRDLEPFLKQMEGGLDRAVAPVRQDICRLEEALADVGRRRQRLAAHAAAFQRLLAEGESVISCL